MTNIENYMHDGANWQAQCVLAYLRATKNIVTDKTWNRKNKCYDSEICVGRYENTREQGYIFSIKYMCNQRNYCVYEHRNSDELCVVVFDALTFNTPKAEAVFNAMDGNKYNYTKAFPCGKIIDCGVYILNDMGMWIEDLIKNKEG